MAEEIAEEKHHYLPRKWHFQVLSNDIVAQLSFISKKDTDKDIYLFVLKFLFHVKPSQNLELCLAPEQQRETTYVSIIKNMLPKTVICEMTHVDVSHSNTNPLPYGSS